jgi:hypothetical protein
VVLSALSVCFGPYVLFSVMVAILAISLDIIVKTDIIRMIQVC